VERVASAAGRTYAAVGAYAAVHAVFVVMEVPRRDTARAIGYRHIGVQGFSALAAEQGNPLRGCCAHAWYGRSTAAGWRCGSGGPEDPADTVPGVVCR